MKAVRILPLPLLVVVALLSLVQCDQLAQQQCSATKSHVDYNYANANVILTASIIMRNGGSGGVACGSPNGATMQWFEAVKYAINDLNNRNGGQGFLPGVTFGLRLYDSCYSPVNALRDLQEMFPQTTSYNPYCSAPNSGKVVLGMLGPWFSSIATHVASYAKDVPVTLVAPSAMSTELSNTEKYPTFFRTIPTSREQMKAVATVLKQMNWNKVVVLHSDGSYGSDSYKQLLELSTGLGICLSQAITMPLAGSVSDYVNILRALGSNDFGAGIISATDSQARKILEAINQVPEMQQVQWVLIDVDMNTPASSIKYMRGAITVQPQTMDLPGFQDYFTGLEVNPTSVGSNPWFKEWYESVYMCSLDVGSSNPCPPRTQFTASQEFLQSTYVLPTVKAVYAYAEVMKSLCPGGQVCQAARDATQASVANVLRNMDVTLTGDMAGQKIRFLPNGDSLDSTFTVFQYNGVNSGFSFKNIATYQNGLLSMTSTPVFYDQTRDNALGAAPVVTCATAGCNNCLMPPQQVDFLYTQGEVVIGSLINAGQSAGSPFACGSMTEGGVASIVAARWAIQQYKTSNSNKLQGVSLGSLVANVCPSGAVAAGFLNDLLGLGNSILNNQGVAITASSQILGFVDDTDPNSAASIAPILSHYQLPEIQAGSPRPSGDYPYFISAVPDHDVFLNALTSLLQAKDWTHVQVVTEQNNDYSRQAKAFRHAAVKRHICVVNMHYFDNGVSSVLNSVLGDPNAFVVVTFGSAQNVKALFDQIKTAGAKDKIQVISGVMEWGTDPAYFDMTTSEPQYAITLGMSSATNNNFQSYLMGLSDSAIQQDPYLTTLFEMANQCSLSIDTRSLYPTICSTASFSPYRGNADTVIQSIFSMADSLHKVIEDLCGLNYNGICADFRKSSDISRMLVDKLRDSSSDFVQNVITYNVVNNGNYHQFGSYNTAERTLTTIQGAPGANLLSPQLKDRATSCGGNCLDCQYLYVLRDTLFLPGDYLIAGSFGMSSSGPATLQPYMCGDADAGDALYTTAMFYALNEVNQKTAPVSVQGLTIGGLAFDHCNNEGRQKLIVSDVYSGLLSPTLRVTESSILSWVTGGSTASRETAELLQSMSIPVVSPDATSEALLDDFEHFFRTIPGDATTAGAFVKIAKFLGITNLKVVHSSSVYGRDSKDSLKNIAQMENVCVTSTHELSSDAEAATLVSQLVAQGPHVVVLIMETSSTQAMMQAIVNNPLAVTKLLIMLPEPFTNTVKNYGSQLTYPPIALRLKTSALTRYIEYLKTTPVENVFFARMYMKVFQCNLQGYHSYSTPCPYPLANIVDHQDFVLSTYSLSTMNSVFASVDALDKTIQHYCGRDYITPCGDFLVAPDQRQMYLSFLEQASYADKEVGSFQFLQREGYSGFDILQNNALVGSFSSLALSLDISQDPYASVDSRCGIYCGVCTSQGLEFSLTPGDIYLAGMFDIHQASLDPFTCGRIKSLHGYLLMEAFHFALDKVNSKEGQFKDILKGVTLGGVGLDACSSQVRGGQLVSNINNGITPLTKGGVTVNPSTIDTYIGSYFSSASQYLARILTDLEIPQISYASQSVELSDERVYPYFFRTVPSTRSHAEAILTYLDKMDIRYIQILYTDNSFGLSGRDDMVKLAADYKICIAQTVAYPDRGEDFLEESRTVVSSLKEKPAANTVITFMDTSYINSVLKAIKDSDTKDTFRFVGSDSWADNQDAIEDTQDFAVDSVTFKLDTTDLPDFESYMDSKRLYSTLGNAWFLEYYQEMHNCFLSEESNPWGYDNACSQSAVSVITSSKYKQDPSVINVINAVYAAAFAIHKTLQHECGTDYQAVCQNYRKNADRHESIRDDLALVQFKDPTDRDFKFTDRQADINYKLFAVVKGSFGGIIYQGIGSYDTTSKSLTLTESFTPAKTWPSGCDRKEACTECPAIRDSTLRYAFYNTGTFNPQIPLMLAFFDIHHQGVDSYRCGGINPAGVQQLLAFMYGANKIDQDVNVLILDTCSNPTRLDQDLFGLLQGRGICNVKFTVPDGLTVNEASIKSVLVSGDRNTEAASRILEPLSISYVSPNAVSPLLDGHQHLARTVAPVSAQMQHLANLLKTGGWSFMDVVYEESAVGYNNFHQFRYQADSLSLCMGSSLELIDEASDQTIQGLLEQLNGNKGSKVVVYFGSSQGLIRVLEAARLYGIVGDYTWIWAMDMPMDSIHLPSIVNAGTDLRLAVVYPKRVPVKDFESFVKDVTLPDSFPSSWKDYVRMIDTNILSQDRYVLNTVAATYAAANNTRDTRAQILEDILDSNVNLKDEDVVEKDLVMTFNQDRWWAPGYSVQMWDSFNKQFVELNETDSQLANYINMTSACTESPSEGFCGCPLESAATSGAVQASPDYEPGSHRNFFLYKDGEKEYDWPIWAVVVAIVTGLGLLVAVILFLYLLIAYPNKGGTSVLGYMMIVGIIGIYAVNFAFFLSANEDTCLVRRLVMGVVYAICLAPMLIKAVDNWRFGHLDHSDRKYRGVSSACSYFMSAVGLVAIECIIPVMWLILVHPDAATYAYGDGRHDNNWCLPADEYDLGLVLSFMYIIVLVLLTAIFAGLGYVATTNNNESRWILFGAVATAGCFLVWMIVVLNADAFYRDPAVAIANCTNATILLLVIPVRKAGLLCRSRNGSEKSEAEPNEDPYVYHDDQYQEAYNNGYQLSDFEKQPSEF